MTDWNDVIQKLQRQADMTSTKKVWVAVAVNYRGYMHIVNQFETEDEGRAFVKNTDYLLLVGDKAQTIAD